MATAYRGRRISSADHGAAQRHTDRQETGEAELRKRCHFRTDNKNVQDELMKRLKGMLVIVTCNIMKRLGG